MNKQEYKKPEIVELSSALTSGQPTVKINTTMEDGNSNMGPGFTAS